MKKNSLPYGKQWIDAQDIKEVAKALRSSWITQGPTIERFEKRIAESCGVKYGIAVSSGTAALHAAYAVAGIGDKDEIITTPLTFAATANAAVYCGATPVLADILSDTLTIDPAAIEKKITTRTKAIAPVDFAGHPCEYDEIIAIAKKHKILVIEDAAHALGSEYKKRPVGSFADMTILSFHPVKAITTGEGGMVLTNDKNLFEKLKVFRHHGVVKKPEQGPWYYEIDQPGYNYRITDLQCALGLSQFRKLRLFIKRRREIVAMYNTAFEDCEELIVPVERPYVKTAYHIYVLRLRLERLRVGRRQVFEALQSAGIGCQVHYVPIHYHPFYQKKFGYKKGDFPVTEQYYEGAITLPLFPKMTDVEVRKVVRSVRSIIGSYRK
ncbi:MAG: UDP-4-amino-4,6-dideoxy-N-acetyl-beta-L-altrosamine transaminase [Candidatus Wildermuthbacteria bacterium]|nr:UDP-4-amino-4,6-dideoxy-N-acetyl-beta-L-altrosamine transaminase [Candidatus Wildermuthbacteria bacterium]